MKTTLSPSLCPRLTFHSLRFNRFTFKIKWMCEANSAKADTHTLISNWCEFHFDYAIFQYCSPYLYQILMAIQKNRIISRRKPFNVFFAWRPIVVLPSVFLYSFSHFSRWSVHSFSCDRLNSLSFSSHEMHCIAISHAQKITRTINCIFYSKKRTSFEYNDWISICFKPASASLQKNSYDCVAVDVEPLKWTPISIFVRVLFLFIQI